MGKMSISDPIMDQMGRPLESLRISVTDRCNLRCRYCMPEQEYVWLPRADILHYEELSVLVDAFTLVGVKRVRLTGGEPLLRRDLEEFIAMLAAKPEIEDLALTTNGVTLAGRAEGLKQAGLGRLTISLDTLDRERFEALTGHDDLEHVLAGIEAAAAADFQNTKLDCVVMRGVNEDEIPDLIRFASEKNIEARFIEYMDVGGATNWKPSEVVERVEILARAEDAFGPLESLAGRGSAPAERHRTPDGMIFGVVPSVTVPFCGACDRSRLTADGTWLTCLYAKDGRDLRTPLREGASREDLARRIAPLWGQRSDRGAEELLGGSNPREPVPVEALRGDPHLEMHTRGG